MPNFNKTRGKSHMWTKEEIKMLVRLWESHTLAELAKTIGTSEASTYSMVQQLRQAGFKIAKKMRVGYIKNLINEVKAEGGY